jgi:hypothetical protein
MAATAIALAAASIAPTAAAAAQLPITFGVDIGGNVVTVINSAHADTSVRLRDADGNTKAEGVLGDTDPFFILPAGVTVETGDRIRAGDGTYARTFIVPALTITIDRVTDTAHGTGPALRTIKLGWGGRFGDVFESHGVRVGQDGTWSFHLPFDVPGGQGIALSWKTPNGDRVSSGGSAAVLVVRLGSPRFFGNSAEPFTGVEVNIDGAHDGDWNGQSDQFGVISGRFRRPNGKLIQVAVGDHISAPSLASDLDWVVPEVEVAADATTEQVTGHCGGALGVIELFRTGHHRGLALVSPGDSDEFEFDFSDPMASDYVTGIAADEANVKHGDSLRIECIMGTGDSVLFRTVVP